MLPITALLTLGAFIMAILALVQSSWKDRAAWAVLFLSLLHLLALPVISPH